MCKKDLKINKNDKFVNLHLHTSRGSILDALSKPEDVVKKIASINQSSFACTEHGTTLSATQVYKLAKSYGLKHIYGCEFYLAPISRFEKDKDHKYNHLTVLAYNEEGRININKLVSLGFIEGFYSKPRIDFELLKEHKNGLIILSGCMAGLLQQTLAGGKIGEHVEITEENYIKAKGVAKKFKDTFGDKYFLEVQSHRDKRQGILNESIVKIAKELNIKWVATADSHFVEEEDLEIHSIFIQIGTNREPHEDTYKDTHIQTFSQAMQYLQPFLSEEDAETACINTLLIADMCDVHVPLSEPIIPHVDIPKKYKDENDYLKYLINKGWIERKINKKPKEIQDVYKKRVKYEMDAVEKMGFSGYFLLVESYANSVTEKGTARGSGAGSLINYLLKITDVDPIPYGLYFERFIDVGALEQLEQGTITRSELKIPDIDLDFSPKDRDKIIENITCQYGKEHFASLGQFGYMWTKSAIKDVGRVLGVPFDVTNKITSQIGDFTIGFAREAGLMKEWFEKYQKLFEYAEKLEGIPKSHGTHPCGRIITLDNINYYGSVTVSPTGEYVLQSDMHDAEDLGLVKIDTLSIASLQCIYDCLNMIGKDSSYIASANLNFEDEKILKLFKDGNTGTIFQFSSNGMKETLRQIQPTGIEDLTVANALFRPSSMKFIEHYAKRKNGVEDVQYLHPDLEEVLGETFGIFIFQEQLITLGKIAGMRNPDKLRKATGKKSVELMKECRIELEEGLYKRGWNKEQLDTLWDIMLDFASYSFNKSHALSYSIIAWQMAMLRVYHPVEFMVALMNSTDDKVDIVTYIEECKKMGIKILPPDINKSKTKFTKEGDAIRFGLQAIKSVGLPTIEIIEKVKSTQLMLTDGMSDKFFGFNDFYDVMQVMINESQYEDEDGNTVYAESGLPKDAIIALIKSGAFGMKRNLLLKEYAEMLYIPLIYKERKTLPSKKDIEKLGIVMSEDDYKDKEKRASIFNEAKYAEYLQKDNARKQRHLDEFSEKYIRNEKFYDFDTMACYLQLSPFDDYMNRLTDLHDYDNGESKIIIMGTILEKEVKKASRGGQYAKLSIVTPFGVYFGKIYSAQYTEYKDLIEKGQTIVSLVKKNNDEFIVSKLMTFKEWKDNLERKRELKKKREEFNKMIKEREEKGEI